MSEGGVAKGAGKANAKIKDEKKRDVREQNIMAAKCELHSLLQHFLILFALLWALAEWTRWYFLANLRSKRAMARSSSPTTEPPFSRSWRSFTL